MSPDSSLPLKGRKMGHMKGSSGGLFWPETLGSIEGDAERTIAGSLRPFQVRIDLYTLDNDILHGG